MVSIRDIEFSLAIEDDLANELCNFKENKNCNRNIIEKLLHYYKPYPLFNNIFLKRYYGKDFLTSLISSKINWGNVDSKQIDLEASYINTIYKVILSSDKTKQNFPYIYIGGDVIENNFTATFMKQDNRQKAIEHLKALLENANCVFIYDAYLFENNVWGAFVNFAQQCFPNKQLNIFYPQSIATWQNIQTQCSQIIRNNAQWRFRPDRIHQNFTNLHDRYLIIDNKIEVIFTSGIHHLMNNSKDFTYIVRQHK